MLQNQSNGLSPADAAEAASYGDAYYLEEDSPVAAAAGDYRQFLAASIDKLKQGGEVSGGGPPKVFWTVLDSRNSRRHEYYMFLVSRCVTPLWCLVLSVIEVLATGFLKCA